MYKYLYYKTYYFYKKVMGIENRTHVYPSIVIGFLLTSNLMVILGLSMSLLNFESDSFYATVTVIGGNILIFGTVFYMGYQGRYKMILSEVEKLESGMFKRLKLQSTAYVSFSIISFLLYQLTLI